MLSNLLDTIPYIRVIPKNHTKTIPILFQISRHPNLNIFERIDHQITACSNQSFGNIFRQYILLILKLINKLINRVHHRIFYQGNLQPPEDRPESKMRTSSCIFIKISY